MAKVLLVEDNVVCQKLMNRMITKAMDSPVLSRLCSLLSGQALCQVHGAPMLLLGYECIVADNGAGAVEAYPLHRPRV